MKKLSTLSPEMKVGLFAGLILLILAYATLRVSDRGLFQGGYYKVTVVIDSAEGLSLKTPVELAGIQVGFIDKLDLHQGRHAKAELKIRKDVILGTDAVAQVRTKGFLGETYVDLKPGNADKGVIPEGGAIQATNPYVDLGQIASDFKEVTDSFKVFAKTLTDITVQNQENINQMIVHLRNFSEDVSLLIADKNEAIRDSIDRLDEITRKVNDGQGTIGRLINDDEIAENINEAARGVSETVGGINRFQAQIGFHTEYLSQSSDFKNYVELMLKPRPDKYFLLEFVVDPNPSPTTRTRIEEVTTGGTTTTTVTERSEVIHNKFLISGQLAKKFYDFTIRGGVIESSGGAGFDYDYGPFTVKFSAFDFRTDDGQRPHLKAWGNLNLTKNLFLLAGADDFISSEQDIDWFFGAGFRLVDEDLKSLLGATSLR